VLEKQKEIDEVSRNIELLRNSKNVALAKQVFLESNKGEKQEAQVQKKQTELERANTLSMM